MYHLLEDFKDNYTNLPLYQSGSGGESAVVVIGQKTIMILQTYESDLIATILDKEKLKVIKPSDLIDKADMVPIKETLKGNARGFGRIFLDNLSLFHDKNIILYERKLRLLG